MFSVPVASGPLAISIPVPHAPFVTSEKVPAWFHGVRQAHHAVYLGRSTFGLPTDSTPLDGT